MATNFVCTLGRSLPSCQCSSALDDGLLHCPRCGADSCRNEETALQCEGVEMPGCW